MFTNAHPGFVRSVFGLVTILTCCLLAVSAMADAVATPQYDRGTNVWSFHKSIPPVPEAPPTGSADLGIPGGQRWDWSFSPNLRVHPDESGQHIWADIALAPDGTLGLAWMDNHGPSGYYIYYSSSTDGGVSWSPPERVDDRVSGAYSKFVSLAFTPSGVPVAVWEDDRTGQYNLYFSKRDPASPTDWTPDVQVNTTGSPPSGSDYMNGSLTILDDTRSFVAWTDWREGVFHQVYSRGTWDGGVTWGPESRVSDGLGYDPLAGDPCLIVDPTSGPIPGEEVLYCVSNDWRGDVPGGRFPNVYFYRSTDGGASWSVGVQVNDIEPYFQQCSSHALVYVEDGSLACGWLNNPDWSMNHYHVNVSTDAGATWGASQQVDEPSAGGTGTYSSIATAGEWVFASFGVYRSDWDTFFRASADGGLTWVDPMVRVDDDTSGAAAGRPVLAASSTDMVHVAWEDTRPPGTNWKIFYSTGVRLASDVEWSSPCSQDLELSLRVIPNPSRMGSPVSFLLVGRGGRTRDGMLAIYDVSGRCIRTLWISNGACEWDGCDHRGQAAPTGCYWLSSISGARFGTTKAVWIR